MVTWYVLLLGPLFPLAHHLLPDDIQIGARQQRNFDTKNMEYTAVPTFKVLFQTKHARCDILKKPIPSGYYWMLLWAAGNLLFSMGPRVGCLGHLTYYSQYKYKQTFQVALLSLCFLFPQLLPQHNSSTHTSKQ